MPESNIQKLELARNKIADVFKNEVEDDHFDNGNLDAMTHAIKELEIVIVKLKERQ